MSVATIRIKTVLYDGSICSKTLLDRNALLKMFEGVGTMEDRVERHMRKFFQKFAIPSSFAIGVFSIAGQAFAAAGPAMSMHSLADKLMPLLRMVQDFALPVGITVSSWGLIEMIMGNIESGKHKMKWAIIGYIGMFLIPQVFYAIRDAFSA